MSLGRKKGLAWQGLFYWFFRSAELVPVSLLITTAQFALYWELSAHQGGWQQVFLSGGRISGCYGPVGRIEPGIELFIVEGIATAFTLHE
ncbi:hypothetical protein ACIPQ1_26490 [Pseudomonas sp. LARHCG127]